jgi:hypothetical protein
MRKRMPSGRLPFQLWLGRHSGETGDRVRVVHAQRPCEASAVHCGSSVTIDYLSMKVRLTVQ